MPSNRLLTTGEVSELLRVSPRTVLNWIDHDAVPYLALPSAGDSRRREYRIPLYGLLNSLSGTYDLGSQLETLDEAAQSGQVDATELQEAAEVPASHEGEDQTQAVEVIRSALRRLT